MLNMHAFLLSLSTLRCAPDVTSCLDFPAVMDWKFRAKINGLSPSADFCGGGFCCCCLFFFFTAAEVKLDTTIFVVHCYFIFIGARKKRPLKVCGRSMLNCEELKAVGKGRPPPRAFPLFVLLLFLLWSTQERFSS